MVPQIESVAEVSDFDRIVNAMSARLSGVSGIDYEAARRDLRELCVSLEGDFTPDSLGRDLALVQGLKDRAVAILDTLTNSYLLHKRVAEILTSGWSKYCSEKGADKREGEAALKMSQFLMAASEAESAYRYALNVVRNLESQQESVSRRITCLQSAAQIQSYRYGAYDKDVQENDGRGERTGESEGWGSMRP